MSISARQREFAKKQRLRKIQAGLLALVFVVVLCFQFAGVEAERVGLVKLKKVNASDSLDGPKLSPELPSIPLDQILASDPFGALRGTKPKPKKAQRRPRASISIDAVYRTQDAWAVLIDSEVYRTGDYLPSGDLLVDITPDGIQVQRAE